MEPPLHFSRAAQLRARIDRWRSEPRNGEFVQRHSALVRVTHWLNAAAIAMLLMSGLQIFNAHPALYWGEASNFSQPWLAIDSIEQSDGVTMGYAEIAGRRADTTGFLGLSMREGQMESRAFPSWITLPAALDLATGRRWHFLVAWVFATNLAIYLTAGLVGGHLRRDLLPLGPQLWPKHVLQDFLNHLRLRFPRGDAARSYNILQKISYLGVVLVLLPLAVITGCCLSPALNAVTPWLVDAFGGRQSARSIHFIVANLIVLFTLVHLAMVVLSGAWNNIRSMLTGRYDLRLPRKNA